MGCFRLPALLPESLLDPAASGLPSRSRKVGEGMRTKVLYILTDIIIGALFFLFACTQEPGTILYAFGASGAIMALTVGGWTSIS